jgi:membrane-bound metal-dependent hydrolase YbcI (DUF457 family)
MIIGHFGVGLAAKRAAPRIRLGTLFMASQLIDLIWPLFIMLGIEHVRVAPGITAVTPLDFYHYPFTHSLLGVVFWAALLGWIFYLIRKSVKGSVLLGILVISHWVLDLITHAPDLPVAPGIDMFLGLGLWNSFYGSLILELAIFTVGLILYIRMTKARDLTGIFALWGLAIFLVAITLANYFGPPPPDDRFAVGLVGEAQWLIIIWAYWIDRHRMQKQESKKSI